MQRGFISVYRKLQDHEFWRERREFSKLEAWLYLLLNANHCPNSFTIGNNIFHLKRGQLMRSLGHLAHDFGWGIKRVRLFLTLCQEMKMIELKSGTVATQITICNYDTYQYSGQEEDTLGAHLGHDQGTLRATNKELKNVRNKEETPLPPKKKPASKGRGTKYHPETGPDGFPQIGDERSEKYRAVVKEWWIAYKAARGIKPVWTPTYDDEFERLAGLDRPIEEYRVVFRNGFMDDFDGPSLSPGKCAAKFPTLRDNIPRTKLHQVPAVEEPRRDLREIIADQVKAINDNEGY